MAQKTKPELLATKMHQLMPDERIFNRWFVRTEKTTGTILNEESVPTLAEFFARNTNVPQRSDVFWCGNDIVHRLARSSAAYLILEAFLLGNGFDWRDWVGLAYVGKQLKLFPMSVLKKEEAATFPLAMFCNRERLTPRVKKGYMMFMKLFEPQEHATVSVAQILDVPEKRVMQLIAGCSSVEDFKLLSGFITSLQASLREYALDDSESPFMGLKLQATKQGTLNAFGRKTFKQDVDLWRHAV